MCCEKLSFFQFLFNCKNVLHAVQEKLLFPYRNQQTKLRLRQLKVFLVFLKNTIIVIGNTVIRHLLPSYYKGPSYLRLLNSNSFCYHSDNVIKNEWSQSDHIKCKTNKNYFFHHFRFPFLLPHFLTDQPGAKCPIEIACLPIVYLAKCLSVKSST